MGTVTAISSARAKAAYKHGCPRLPARVLVKEEVWTDLFCFGVWIGRAMSPTRPGLLLSVELGAHDVVLYEIQLKNSNGTTTIWYYSREEFKFAAPTVRGEVVQFRRA